MLSIAFSYYEVFALKEFNTAYLNFVISISWDLQVAAPREGSASAGDMAAVPVRLRGYRGVGRSRSKYAARSGACLWPQFRNGAFKYKLVRNDDPLKNEQLEISRAIYLS